MATIDLFLPNMRGSSVTVGTRVHTLFLVNSAKPKQRAVEAAANEPASTLSQPASEPAQR